MGIKLDYASVYHPQTNGQVERANGLIMSGIKPRLVRSLTESDTHWVEELDSVLWVLRTTPNRTNWYTPLFMVYGAEAVLPCDIIHDSPRVRMYEEKEAKLDRQDNLDALEEERDIAKARSASINLVNLSTMTNKYFFLWLPPLRGPTISSPQTAKGQVMGIVCSGIWL